MSDWEDYAQRNVLNDNAYAAEPVQTMRVEAMARRSTGSVLDVGGGDGFFAKRISNVTMVDISPIRVARAQALGVSAIVGDATDLPFDDNSYDTVVLGEVLEHLDDPGKAFAEAFRVSRGRVVISLPLNGWEDPTHEWRISIDDLCRSRADGEPENERPSDRDDLAEGPLLAPELLGG